MTSKNFYSLSPSEDILTPCSASRNEVLSNSSALDKLVVIISSIFNLGLLSVNFIFDVLYQLAIIDSEQKRSAFAITTQADLTIAQGGTSIWFSNQSDLVYFSLKIITQYLPIISNLGPYFVIEVSKFSMLQGTAEFIQLNASIEDFNLHETSSSAMKSSLPETFLKPFREEMDSRHEYKTKNENAIFNERERCFDEFCNLISKFQQVSKIDVDGFKTSMFYTNDLMAHGSTILTLQASNISWFSDMFTKLLLFHSLNNNRGMQTIEKPNNKGNMNRIQPVAVKLGDKDCSKVADGNSGHIFLSPPPNNMASSDSNTTASPHTNTLRNLNINVKQFSKLEERLGSGGMEVPHSMTAKKSYSGPKPNQEKLSTATSAHAQKRFHNSNNSSTSTSTSSTAFKSHGDNNSSSSRSYLQAATPTSTASSGNKKLSQEKKDDYEEAAIQFSGIQQFFFRFIVSMNNHRFNQHLINSISSEIHKLSEEYDSSPTSIPSSRGKKKQKEFRGDDLFAGAGDEIASREFFAGGATIALSPETFTVKVMKLKVLGKFLGLLHFYHLWSQLGPLESEDLGAQSPSPLSLYAKESAGLQSRLLLKSVLPINSILITSSKQGRLCLTVSWVVEFLKMMNWSSLLRFTNFQPYSDTFHLLHSLQMQVHSWITNDTNPAYPRLSSNRLYYAIDIQYLFAHCKFDFSSERPASQDFIHAAHSQSEDVLDAQSLSFYASFLRHVLPDMEKYYLLIREQNQLKQKEVQQPGNKAQLPGASSIPAVAATAAAKNTVKKKQSPSIVIPTQQKSSFAGDEVKETHTARTLDFNDQPSILPLPQPPLAYSPDCNIAINRYPILSLDTSSAGSHSPTPMRTRTRGSQPVSPTKKSSSKILQPSPAISNNSVYQEHDHGYSSVSIPMSPLHLSTESSNALLNTSFTSENNTSVFADRNSNEASRTDISDRLENAFWTQHAQLHLISQFLLSHTSQACSARIKQQVATSVQEFLSFASSCDLSGSKASCNSNSNSNGNASPTKVSNSLEAGMQKSYRQLLEEGRRVIVEFYADCTASLLPKLFGLYPMDNRVSDLAVSLMKGQVSIQMTTMISHLKAYGLRKLKEAYALTVKQHSKGTNKHAMSIQRTKRTLPLEMTSDKAIASHQVTQQHLVESESNLRSALASLLEFFDIRTSVEVIDDLRGDILSTFTKYRLSFVAKADYILSGTAIATVDSNCVLRNRLAKFFITIHKLSCCMAEWAQSSGFSMITKIPFIRRFPNIGALSMATENMAALYSAVTNSIVCSVVEVEARSGLDSQVARGKFVIDVVKFVTLSVPMILYLDVLLAATRYSLSSTDPHDNKEEDHWEAVDGLLKIKESSGNPPPMLLSDILFLLMDQFILSEGSFVKMLSCVGKRKNTAAFEACRSIQGLQEAASRALGFIIAKYVHTNEHQLLENQSFREDKRAHMKALLGDDLFALVEQHITT
eukprot:gene29422-38516_t